MVLLALATKIQELSPTRLNDAAAVLMAQGLLETFFVQERATKAAPWATPVEVPKPAVDAHGRHPSWRGGVFGGAI